MFTTVIITLVLLVISFLSFLMFAGQNLFKGYFAFSIIVYCLACIWIGDDIGILGVVLMTIIYASILVVLWTKYRPKLFFWWSEISGFQTNMAEVKIGELGSTITSLNMDGTVRYKGKKYYAKSATIVIPANFSVTIDGIEGCYLLVKPN
ncbi:MAG: NfeD family protein [Bacteroidota bacterium]